MNKKEAAEIAKAALPDIAKSLNLFAAKERDRSTGESIWKVSTQTTGSGWHVYIDDATGNVLSVERWGIR